MFPPPLFSCPPAAGSPERLFDTKRVGGPLVPQGVGPDVAGPPCRSVRRRLSAAGPTWPGTSQPATGAGECKRVPGSSGNCPRPRGTRSAVEVERELLDRADLPNSIVRRAAPSERRATRWAALMKAIRSAEVGRIYVRPQPIRCQSASCAVSPTLSTTSAAYLHWPTPSPPSSADPTSGRSKPSWRRWSRACGTTRPWSPCPWPAVRPRLPSRRRW